MRRLFISDLHLTPARPELTQLACQFLEAQQDQVDEIYILGDIFNTWLGDDLVPTEFNLFVTTLQKLSESGIRLFLMVGNRDFMLGKDFATEVGATLLVIVTQSSLAITLRCFCMVTRCVSMISATSVTERSSETVFFNGVF